MNWGHATGAHVHGDLVAMPTVYNTPVSFLGGGIDQDDIFTGHINQMNFGHADGGKLKQSASIGFSIPVL